VLEIKKPSKKSALQQKSSEMSKELDGNNFEKENILYPPSFLNFQGLVKISLINFLKNYFLTII